jgi:eukaryotic-like serine/threonine-protein kinase
MYKRVKPNGARLGKQLTVVGLVSHGPESVYMAWHHGKWCALACKIMKSRKRALRESSVLQALSHPNIVRGLGVEGQTNLLMEYLDGPTLRDFIRSRPRKRMSLSDAMRVAIHIGGALAHMHERGFVYLDVKPSNIIIFDGRPILFDVGTAQKQKKLKSVIGTDDYMAPEQCSKGRVGPYTDVFGLGVSLYQMLTGKLPYTGYSKKNPHPQLERDPVSLRRYLPKAPASLDQLVLACLHRDPKQRPKLPELLPALHAYIRSGSPMWPSFIRL